MHPDTSWLTAAALRLCVRRGLTVSPLPISTGAALYCLHAPPGGPAHRRATSNQSAERRGSSSAGMLPSAGVGISISPAVRERLCRKIWKKKFIYKTTCWKKDVQSENGSWEEVGKKTKKTKFKQELDKFRTCFCFRSMFEAMNDTILKSLTNRAPRL